MSPVGTRRGSPIRPPDPLRSLLSPLPIPPPLYFPRARQSLESAHAPRRFRARSAHVPHVRAHCGGVRPVRLHPRLRGRPLRRPHTIWGIRNPQ
eukprot:1388909-Pleurochrysis_carterae.AAC.1